MAEYIEREAALEEIVNADVMCDIPADAYRVLRRYIERIPAADVAPVRHGRWVPDKEDVEWGNSLIHYRCSECKKRPHFDKEKYRFILSPFCPNCGAKMDGSEEVR